MNLPPANAPRASDRPAPAGSPLADLAALAAAAARSVSLRPSGSGGATARPEDTLVWLRAAAAAADPWSADGAGGGDGRAARKGRRRALRAAARAWRAAMETVGQEPDPAAAPELAFLLCHAAEAPLRAAACRAAPPPANGAEWRILARRLADPDPQVRLAARDRLERADAQPQDRAVLASARRLAALAVHPRVEPEARRMVLGWLERGRLRRGLAAAMVWSRQCPLFRLAARRGWFDPDLPDRARRGDSRAVSALLAGTWTERPRHGEPGFRRPLDVVVDREALAVSLLDAGRPRLVVAGLRALTGMCGPEPGAGLPRALSAERVRALVFDPDHRIAEAAAWLAERAGLDWVREARARLVWRGRPDPAAARALGLGGKLGAGPADAARLVALSEELGGWPAFDFALAARRLDWRAGGKARMARLWRDDPDLRLARHVARRLRDTPPALEDLEAVARRGADWHARGGGGFLACVPPGAALHLLVMVEAAGGEFDTKAADSRVAPRWVWGEALIDADRAGRIAAALAGAPRAAAWVRRRLRPWPPSGAGPA